MNYRYNYPTCQLHDQPLNYICLHANCKENRLICVLCQSQRHNDGHYTRPLKMYMTQKVHKLKCLTQSEIQHIINSLQHAKIEMVSSMNELATQIGKRIQEMKNQFETMYDEQIESMENLELLVNEEEIPIEGLSSVEKILSITSQYEHYQDVLNTKINQYRVKIQSIFTPINFQQMLQSNWIHHEGINVHNHILHSNNSEYKVAVLQKTLKFKNSQAKFKMVRSPKNWLAVGVCHRNIIEQRGFSFRYHTIGHGIYGISSNGGSWSSYRRQHNNKLCGLHFKENQIVKVCYDSANNRVKFVLEGGEKYYLEIDPNEKGCLNFCVVMYHENDEIEMITE